MSFARTLALSTTLLAASVAAQATTVNLAADGQWNEFTVDEFASATFGTEWIDAANTLDAGYGSPLSFNFTIYAGQTGTLTVVDAGFAGDRFAIFDNGNFIGTTRPVPQASYTGSETSVADFDFARANPRFSKGVFTFGEGSYSITGQLVQSALLSPDNTPLNSTLGAVNLTVVPEPSSVALVLAGAGVLLASRRRAAR